MSRIDRTEGVENMDDRNISMQPAARWTEAFKVFYALTEDNFEPITNKDTEAKGLIRKQTGEALTVRLITLTMLLDPGMQEKISKLMDQKLLGGVDEEGQVHFHEDIAKSFNLDRNHDQKFKVLNEDPANQTETVVQRKVVSVNESSYQHSIVQTISNVALGILPIVTEDATKVAEKMEKDLEKNRKELPKATEPTTHKTSEARPAKPKPVARKNIREQTKILHEERKLAQALHKQEQKRLKRVREAREAAKQVRSEAIKEEEIEHAQEKHDLKQGIRKSEEINKSISNTSDPQEKTQIPKNQRPLGS